MFTDSFGSSDSLINNLVHERSFTLKATKVGMPGQGSGCKQIVTLIGHFENLVLVKVYFI